MTLRSLAATLVAVSMTVGVASRVDAQPSSSKPATQKPPAPPPAPPATGVKPGADAPPPPPPAPTPDGRARKVGPNVRIEVTFTEQRSDAPAQAKTVTVTTGDGHWGRVRSQAQSSGIGGTPLNVDARPEVQPDGRMVLALTLEYGDKRISQVEMPRQPDGVTVVGVPQRNITDVVMNQSVTVVLESGKPLVITQAADPVSDRKVTVEVKATVLR
jgi:hypothetical protein